GRHFCPVAVESCRRSVAGLASLHLRITKPQNRGARELLHWRSGASPAAYRPRCEGPAAARRIPAPPRPSSAARAAPSGHGTARIQLILQRGGGLAMAADTQTSTN